MKNSLLLLLSFCLPFITVHSQDLTLDEIMQKHYQAAEMEKLQEVNTIILTGLRVQQDLMPLKIIRKRPNLFMMEFDVADMTAYQVFDGEIGWSTAPWTGNAAPQRMPESRARDMMYQADFDGYLYHWKEKGHQMELEGIDTLETGKAYKLKMVRADSLIQYFFIDASDFHLRKQLTYRTIRGEQVPIETIYKDYRSVAEIPFAFVIETRFPGRVVSMEFDSIELNLPVKDSLFIMPE